MFDGETLAKTFTRYIVPGLIFVFLAIIAPASFVNPALFFGKEPQIGATQVVALSILTGYVLDAIRGYRWTLSWRAYAGERRRLVATLAEIVGHPEPNPDDQLARLWKRDEALYNRVFIERAEWVMILETAFSLWLSAVALVAVGFFMEYQTAAPGWPAWSAAPFLFGISLLASKNGIDRMRAHNGKLLEAIRSLHFVGPTKD